MWAYFSRDDVALPGLAAWFAACSLEERDHGAAVRQLAAPLGLSCFCVSRALTRLHDQRRA
jgi:hypothetical protein